ncbi:hypothetical protein ARAM_006149 [Aspergillus rambellii]|uniref:Cytochrome P450 monooxygenase n=1 Tax=Aspergillus rambellii TaxID=308745 RepID=A0A0F8U1Q7_9EURO|nr:hypothetical protein ARAM_006149 [Aspergillus rambellii]
MLHSVPLSLALSVGIFPAVFYVLIDRLPPIWPTSKKALMIGPKHPESRTSIECPYSYIRQLYGKYHWAPFVHKLSPGLKDEEPVKYKMILEIMDAIHLCLMLVDDISDNSDYRKGKPAAHKLYGRSETANRAYYRVTQMLNATVQRFPNLAPFLMQNLEEILQGQDLSLVWRRDGLSSLPAAADEKLAAYRKMASLKTGALFRLLGQLVLENKSADHTMTILAWCSQLQNDFKNVYSSEYAKMKGSLAEDLRNQEYSYPIIIALEAPGGEWVTKALESGSPHNIRKALEVIQSETVRTACFAELKSSTLAGYEPRLLEHCQTFIETISISEGKTLEVTSLIGEFSWDSMGILAVGKPSIFGPGHVQEAEEMKSLARFACLLVWSPWPIILLRNLPVMRNATVRWIEWCKRTVEERKKEDLSYDLFSYLIQDSDSSLGHPEKATHQDLVFDTELAVFAGSDTIASTLNAILFFLAKDPEIFNQLRREVDAAVPFGCTLSHEALAGNPYLEGCINEGLRICPAVMSGVPRETGPEGATIAGVYIPPFTIVSVPTYTMQMDPRNFPEPDKFIPERWSSKPEMIIQKEAFNPFSSGPYACAGRPFAMMEMRLLLATVVRNFDLDFPPGREKQSFETLGGTGPLDCFTTQIPCYHLVFKRRRKA